MVVACVLLDFIPGGDVTTLRKLVEYDCNMGIKHTFFSFCPRSCARFLFRSVAMMRVPVEDQNCLEAPVYRRQIFIGRRDGAARRTLINFIHATRS